MVKQKEDRKIYITGLWRDNLRTGQVPSEDRTGKKGDKRGSVC
jgi:hypothetical protein